MHKHEITDAYTENTRALSPYSLTYVAGDHQLPLAEVVQVLVNLREILGPPCYLNAEFKVGQFRRYRDLIS